MIWLNPADPAVRAGVVSGIYGKEPHSEHGHPTPPVGEIDVIREALAVASDILTPLTAYRIHPAGVAVEEFRATARAHRLTTNYGPVRNVLTVEKIAEDCAPVLVLDGWCLSGDSLFARESSGGDGGGGAFGSLTQWWCGTRDQAQVLRVTYQFGSTITTSARRAVLWLAHQFWLESSGCDECGECELPERTTSITREGIGYTMLDPQSFLSEGKTGIPKVDLWISTVNPRRSLRPVGIYSPDSPPPVNVQIRTVREAWV